MSINTLYQQASLKVKSTQTLPWLAVIFAALLVFLGTFYSSRLLQLHTHWTTADDLDMGYILLAMFFYFSARNLKTTQGKPNVYYLPLLVLLSCSFFISQALDIKTLFFVSLALAYPLCVANILGSKAAKEIIIPWGIVMMAMPFWYIAIPILQMFTVKVVSYIASSMSLTVLVEGNFFTVPTGVVHVAGGCSGLKYFMSSISIALISSALSLRTIKRSILSVIFAAALAMIGNWIRVFILLLVAYYEGVEHPLMADHDTLGWIVFAIVMVPWFFIDKFLDSPNTNADNDPATQQCAVKKDNKASSIKYAKALLVCSALVIGSQYLLVPPKADSDDIDAIELPEKIGDINLSITKPSTWKPAYPPAASTNSGDYILDGERLNVYVLSYPIDGQEEMANSTNSVFNKKQWQLVSDKPWQSEASEALKIRIAHAKSGREHRIVYYWYKHGSTFANSIFTSKLAQLSGAYRNVHSSQLIAISKTCDIRCQQNSAPTPKLEDIFISMHAALDPS
jgi:EpsI family protein